MIRKTMTAVALSASRSSRIKTLGLSFCPSSPSGLVLAVEEIGIGDDERFGAWFGIGMRLRYLGSSSLSRCRVPQIHAGCPDCFDFLFGELDGGEAAAVVAGALEVAALGHIGHRLPAISPVEQRPTYDLGHASAMASW